MSGMGGIERGRWRVLTAGGGGQGKKKLLRKCENKQLPNMIVSINTQGERVYVGDVAER